MDSTSRGPGKSASRRVTPLTFAKGGNPGSSYSARPFPLDRVGNQQQFLRDRLEMSTAEVGLTVRMTNCLEERGIFTVNDLLHATREDLLSISNFGEKTLEEAYIALENIGFYRRAAKPQLAAA